MTTSLKMSMNSVVDCSDVELSKAQLGYLSTRALHKAYDAMVAAYEELAESKGVTKAFVARRLGKKPEQITRWFGGPSNMTMETYAQIFAALGREPVFESRNLSQRQKSNVRHSLCDAAQAALIETIFRDTNFPNMNSLLGLEPPGRAKTPKNTEKKQTSNPLTQNELQAI